MFIKIMLSLSLINLVVINIVVMIKKGPIVKCVCGIYKFEAMFKYFVVSYLCVSYIYTINWIDNNVNRV